MNVKTEEGIQAIIDLQSLAKVKEPKKVIRQRWEKAPGQEKEHTMRAHKMLFPEKYK